MSHYLGTTLKARLLQKNGLVVPGAANALAARVIHALGYEAIYLSGAGLTNTFYAMPDLGFINLTDLASHTQAISQAVPLPLIVDADTGFGNALNTFHTVKVLEAAGAHAIQLEDQINPKKCGHFNDKGVISKSDMVGKIKAAVDARRHQDFLIIARTDARAVEGFESAIERALAYEEAGADVLFVEAPESVEEIKAIPQRLSSPQIINMVIGGKTPNMHAKEFSDMGFGMVLYANAALQGAVKGMQLALGELKTSGRLDE
ncbi:MAG: isocitrate lyase/phosphoenolpyruvate mutase family protein, partial [Betaproteobacteria bacterium]